MQFRTKARAVDLLGKGQIADLPTAITELWKNGYDAYADNLRADLYKAGYEGLTRSYFILSDDGKGMSNRDILERWLVLGTDSKSRAELDVVSEDTLWKLPRIKAGEKGIGRLSVAYLGNPMLMLTKKLGYSLQALYFDWRLLENYNLFLDDIKIPIFDVNFVDGIEDAFTKIKAEFLTNFAGESFKDEYIVSERGALVKDLDGARPSSNWQGNQIEIKELILEECENATLEPFILNKIQDFFRDDQAHGTMFITFNPISQILDLGEKDDDGLEDRQFVISSLTGFTNPFKDTDIAVSTWFNIHKVEETYDLLNSRGNFFTKSDFDLADVYIRGEFDGDGTFSGSVRIYDQTVEYSHTNPRKKDRRSNYGVIPIELGYTQGEERSSSLNEIDFNQISSKVKEYGGLYVFRDDFRVLPYGRENADFLNFESRRSKRAGSYYFSYRRMYGYLDLTRERNPNLKDKSSREGLINNAQYRAFTNDAINFFVTLAQDYFTTTPKYSIFRDKQKEVNDQNSAVAADKAREKAEKIAFTRALNEYPKRLEAYQHRYTEILALLESRLNAIHVGYAEVEGLLDELQNMDLEFKQLIPKVPKRYKPTETQTERLYKFEDQITKFIERVAPKREELDLKAQEKLEIRDLEIDFTKKINGYISSLEQSIAEHRNRLQAKFHHLSSDYDGRSNRVVDALREDKESLKGNIFSKDQVSGLSKDLEKKYNSLNEDLENTLFPLVEHVARLSFDIDEEQVQGAYKAQYDQMKYQWEQTRDTAQLGIAVEIIDHEFNQLYAKINNQLGVLAGNSSIKEIKEFNFLEKNFKQLEDKYALLSPLYRISGALTKEVTGNTIYQYLLEFFENQISEYDIIFDATDAFKRHSINIKEPVIHTVFINIINNAIYWMRNKEQRIIKLDYFADSGSIAIANSGEEIPDYRLERIFELFYSQRPNGRGIGLYLSKQSLNEAGLDLMATNDKNYNTLNGACFLLTNLHSQNV
ncbi:ATP-binding protein [Pedobacter sp. GSP4]|uniref:ATP-binding protein n=1 Tax=Pedobacter sp. GSP4 TaxID=3453716 RepID=UPI003EEEE762